MTMSALDSIVCVSGARKYLFGNLRKIDLVRQVLITHTVLIPIPRLPAIRVCIDNREMTDVAVKVHFQVHANPVVDTRPGAEDVQICDPNFDDLG